MNLFTRTTIGAVSVGALLATGLSLPAAAGGGPDVSIDSEVHEGTGCKGGSASARLDGDRIKISYEKMTAETEDGAVVRINCITNLKLDMEKGWRYAIGKLSVRGWATLDDDATASATVTHYHAGQPNTGEARTDLTGPYDEEFETFDRQHGNWSECDSKRALNINAAIKVEGGEGIIHLNESRGLIAELKFRKC